MRTLSGHERPNDVKQGTKQRLDVASLLIVRRDGMKGRCSNRPNVPAAQEMRVGPSGSDGQGQGPNHRKLLWHNGWGGERSRKRRDETRQVCAGKTNESEPSTTCRKRVDAIETRLRSVAWEEDRKSVV